MDAYAVRFGAVPAGHVCALPPIFSLCALIIIILVRYGQIMSR